MEHLLAIIFGFCLGVFILSPFVPGLRPITRRVLVGGLAALSAMAAAIAIASIHWQELVAEARAERDARAAAARANDVETITIVAPDR